MSVRKYFTVCAFCLSMFSQNIFSQITVQGIVADQNLQPVQNALVELLDEADTTRKFNDYTDDQGHYFVQIAETGVKDAYSKNPGSFLLMQNYPNPFNPATVIEYKLLKPAHVTLEIYNVLGQKIKTLYDGFQSNWHERIVWDATNDAGQGVPAGLYLYALKADETRMIKKMLLIDGNHSGGKISATGARATNGFDQNILYKHLSNQFLLRVTGNNIETYQQQNLVLVSSMVLDLVVKRTTVTDIDGNIYKTVKIGNQWWMAENLKVTKYCNGDPIPNVTDDAEWSNLSTGAYSNYENTETNVATYGRLYNWYAVNDNRNIAPTDWHVPGDEEWKQLEMNLGMSQSVAENFGWRGTNEGGKLKGTGTTHWDDPNTGATNESGFSALPGGCRVSSGDFYTMGSYAYFWSSTEFDGNYAWRRTLYCSSSGLYRYDDNKRNGFSVRCVRDY